MQNGITGFVRIPNSIDPNKVYAIGPGGRPIKDEADLMKATGASSVAEAWRIANVQTKSPEEASRIGITAPEAKARMEAPPTNNPPANPAPVSTVPDEIKNNPAYKALTDENKEVVNYYWGIQASQDKEKQAAFTKALDMAKEQADPYWAEKINIIKEETTRALTGGQEDLVAKEADLSRRKGEIENNLKYNKEYLSAEQQAELARQASKYETDLDTTRQLMADRGLSSSSIKNQAEEKMKEANEDVITSTRRKYAYQAGSAERTAASNVADIVSQIEQAQRTAQSNAKSSVRKAEEMIGSDEVGKITGADPYKMGGVSIGTVGEQKASDILSRANAMMVQNYPSL